jgi:hypothetical protein
LQDNNIKFEGRQLFLPLMIIIENKDLKFRIREGKSGDEIFDPFRKNWVLLTPEEWVRQSLLGFMVQQLNYSAALIAVERGIKVGELNRRFDAVIYDRNGKPRILVECKAPGEKIEDVAVSQLLAYQSVIGAGYLLLSNGHLNRCWQITGSRVTELEEIPEPNGQATKNKDGD